MEDIFALVTPREVITPTKAWSIDTATEVSMTQSLSSQSMESKVGETPTAHDMADSA